MYTHLTALRYRTKLFAGVGQVGQGENSFCITSVKNMVKNRHLSKGIAGAGWKIVC